MCVIYLLSEKTKAEKDHGRLLLRMDGEKKESIPLVDIDHVVVERRAQLTMPVLYALLEHEVQISYLDGHGNLLGTLGGEQVSIQRILRQKKYFSDPDKQLKMVQELVQTKIMRQRELLLSYGRTHKEGILPAASDDLGVYMSKARQLKELDELRGLEGLASRKYFRAFPDILDRNLWHWQGRNRRPAVDPVNALLNFGYAFLEREVRRVIAGSGLDCRIGFFHSNNGRKDSLVYDLMELFRAKVTDRLVLKLLNYGAFSPEDFVVEDHGCRMNDAARKVWLTHYEKYMEKPVQEYAGQTPREKIRSEILFFADRVFQRKENKRVS